MSSKKSYIQYYLTNNIVFPYIVHLKKALACLKFFLFITQNLEFYIYDRFERVFPSKPKVMKYLESGSPPKRAKRKDNLSEKLKMLVRF